jgi:hypothetical protein
MPGICELFVRGRMLDLLQDGRAVTAVMELMFTLVPAVCR